MPADSWIAPDDVPALAADATLRINEALSRLTETDRDAFWASVRKCYNTPYNDPKPRALPRASEAMTSTPEPQQQGAASSQSFGAAVLAVALAAIPVPGCFPADAQPA